MSSVAVACIALAVPSCLFETRDAANPGTGTTACTLESPGKFKVCMTSAVNEQKDANYERTLSATFIFSPTPADSLDQNFTGTDVYANWNKDRELAVLGTLFSESTKTTVDFGDLQTIINKNTFVRFRSSYTLEVITPNDPSPNWPPRRCFRRASAYSRLRPICFSRRHRRRRLRLNGKLSATCRSRGGWAAASLSAWACCMG